MYTSETVLTIAVTAAAKASHHLGNESLRDTLPPSAFARLSEWDDIGPLVQNQWRAMVLPIVLAALDAVPDPRYAAWEEGYAASFVDASATNPYTP